MCFHAVSLDRLEVASDRSRVYAPDEGDKVRREIEHDNGEPLSPAVEKLVAHHERRGQAMKLVRLSSGKVTVMAAGPGPKLEPVRSAAEDAWLARRAMRWVNTTVVRRSNGHTDRRDRRLGGGRPRTQTRRSSVRSGDSGSSDPDDPEPPSRWLLAEHHVVLLDGRRA